MGAALLIAAGAAGGWFWLRTMPPRVARVLPEADGYLYLNVAALRYAGVKELPEYTDSAQYRDFAQAAGLQFERDIDGAAFARHGELESPQEARYSEVITGKIDRARATAWLRQHAGQTETYNGHDIFVMAIENRSLRVVFLDDKTLAASNALTADPIHQIVDRSRSRFPAKMALLARDYGYVPTGSVGWAIARVSEQAATSGNSLISSTIRKRLSGTVLVAAARYLPSGRGGDLDVTLQVIANTEAQAQRIAEDAGTLLQIYRAAETELKPGGSDADVKAAINSLHLEQEGTRVTLGAKIPARALQKLAAAEK